MVRRNDSPSDDSPTSYVAAGDVPTSAVDAGELPTSVVNLDAVQTSIVRQDDIPTSVMAAVTTTSPPPPKRRSTPAIVATWTGFALVAVAVVAATTAWAGSLRGPGGGSQAAAPSLANVPTVAQVAPPPEPSATIAPTSQAQAPQSSQPKVARGAVRPEQPVPTTAPAPPPVAPPPPAAAQPSSAPPVVTATTSVAPTKAANPILPRSDKPSACEPGETNVPAGCTRAPGSPATPTTTTTTQASPR